MAIIPLIDQAAPIRGSPVSTPSTRCMAGVGDQLVGGGRRACSHIAGETVAPPQSATTATRSPASRSVSVPMACLPPLDRAAG